MFAARRRAARREIRRRGRRAPSSRSARVDSARKSLSRPAGPSARFATGGSACPPRASACARASPRARRSVRQPRDRHPADGHGGQRGCAVRASLYLAATARASSVATSAIEAPFQGLTIFIGRRRLVQVAWRRKSSRIGRSSIKDLIAFGWNSGCHWTPSTYDGPVQRIASTMRSGSDQASTDRLRPRSFTAWWWIELVLTSVAPG